MTSDFRELCRRAKAKTKKFCSSSKSSGNLQASPNEVQAVADLGQDTHLSSRLSDLKTKIFSRSKKRPQCESNTVVPRRRIRLVKRQLPTLKNETRKPEEQSSRNPGKKNSTQNTQDRRASHESSVPYNAVGIDLKAALESTPGMVLEDALDPVGESTHDPTHESASEAPVQAPAEGPVEATVEAAVEAISSQQTIGTTFPALPPCPPVTLSFEHVPTRQTDAESQQILESRAFEAQKANETFFGIPQNPPTTTTATQTEIDEPETIDVHTRPTSAGPHTTDIAGQTPSDVCYPLASVDSHNLVRFSSLRGLRQETSAAEHNDQASSATDPGAISTSSSSSVDVDSQSTQTTIDSRHARAIRTKCIGTIKKATEARVLRSQLVDLNEKCQALEAEKVEAGQEAEKIMFNAYTQTQDLQQQFNEVTRSRDDLKLEAVAKHEQLTKQYDTAQRYMDQRDTARREEASRNRQLDEAGQQLRDGLQREEQQADQIETLSKELQGQQTVAEACRQDFAYRYQNRSQQYDEIPGPVRPDAQDATVRALLHMQIVHRGLIKDHQELAQEVTMKHETLKKVKQKVKILEEENEGLKKSHCQANQLHNANEQYFSLLLEAKRTGDLETQQLAEAGNKAFAKEQALKDIAMDAVIGQEAAKQTIQQQAEEHKTAVQTRDATIEELRKEAIRLEAKSFAFDTDLAESQKLVASLQEEKDNLQAFAAFDIEERIRRIAEDKDNQIANLQQMWNELNCALVNLQQLYKQSEMRVVNRECDLERKLAFPTQMMIERDLLRSIVNAVRDSVLKHPKQKIFTEDDKLEVDVSHLVTVLNEKEHQRLLEYAPAWVQLVGEEQMHHIARDEGVDLEDLEAVESAQKTQRHMQLVANYDWARERDAEDEEKYRYRKVESAEHLRGHDEKNQKELRKREKAWKKVMQLNRKAKKEHGIDVEEDDEHSDDADAYAADSAEDEDEQRVLRVVNQDEDGWETADEYDSQSPQSDQQNVQETRARVQKERVSDSGFLLSSSPAGAPESTGVAEDNGEESQLSEFRFSFGNDESGEGATRPQQDLSEALAAEHKKGHVGRNAPWNRAFGNATDDEDQWEDADEGQRSVENLEEDSSSVLMPAMPQGVLAAPSDVLRMYGMRQEHDLENNGDEGDSGATQEVPLLFAPPTVLAAPHGGGRARGEKYNGFSEDDL